MISDEGGVKKVWGQCDRRGIHVAVDEIEIVGVQVRKTLILNHFRMQHISYKRV